MKKISIFLALIIVLFAAGCSASGPKGSVTQSAQPSGTTMPTENAQSANAAQEPNVWVVKQEAPVLDADSKKEAGQAFAGFMISIGNEKNGLAGFHLDFLDKKGENTAQTKNYTIDTKYMEKKYVEPQATILMISVDMITLKAGGSFYNAQGRKLITFTESTGTFHFIQKSDLGYMMTIDSNVVYAKEADVDYITVPLQ